MLGNSWYDSSGSHTTANGAGGGATDYLRALLSAEARGMRAYGPMRPNQFSMFGKPKVGTAGPGGGYIHPSQASSSQGEQMVQALANRRLTEDPHAGMEMAYSTVPTGFNMMGGRISANGAGPNSDFAGYRQAGSGPSSSSYGGQMAQSGASLNAPEPGLPWDPLLQQLLRINAGSSGPGSAGNTA